tara:strand:+ start:118 stop:882 length:765 start_codon:yes stop_codon:yes gene_type:complete
MANKKISQLTAASALTGTELLAAVQSSTTKQATIDQIQTYINALNTGNKKLKLYGGVCVNTAGTWSLLNDASHTFFNLTSATTVSDRLRINYPTVGKVISMIVTPDETYAQNGISMGASVGLSFANVIMYRDNIVDYISWNGSSFTSSTGQVTSISYSAGLITLNHGTLISPDTTQLGIEGRAGTTTNYRYAWTSLGASSTFIQVLNPDGSEYTGAATTDMRFSFNRGGEVEIDATDSAIAGSNVWVMALMETL